jgi:hypothetical protein
MSDVRLSDHANLRMNQKAMTDAEAEAVVNDPYLTYPADSRQGPGRTIHVRDRVYCVVGTDNTIITFGWSGQETGYQPWTRPSAGQVVRVRLPRSCRVRQGFQAIGVEDSGVRSRVLFRREAPAGFAVPALRRADLIGRHRLFSMARIRGVRRCRDVSQNARPRAVRVSQMCRWGTHNSGAYSPTMQTLHELRTAHRRCRRPGDLSSLCG